MSEPLVVIPNFSTKPEDVAMLADAISSVHRTAGSPVKLLVIDDGSPEPDLVDQVEALGADLGFELYRKRTNTGFSRTVNFGLRRALEEGRDVFLMNADIEMDTPNWVAECRGTKDERGRPAAVVGALLTYPQTGLIQHAGIFFSLLSRRFGEMYKYGPMNLPAALVPKAVPVTGAFQFIRHDCLEEVGIYDEGFKMGWEDVDYCIRVFEAGRQCIYNPRVRAWHHESMFRGHKTEKIKRWEATSFLYLARKYAEKSFADFVPFW